MTDAEFEAIRAHLPEPLKPFMTFCFLTGWRPLSEVATLTWRQVDLDAGAVRLEPPNSKNRQGRFFPFSALPELGALLTQQRERTSEVERGRAASSRMCSTGTVSRFGATTTGGGARASGPSL